MRVLALYDVHGNDDALRAVLEDAPVSAADAVVVGGDVVPGPFALEVLARLDGIATHWLRGNGEREVAGGTKPGADELVVRYAAITREAIGAERAAQLGALPLTVELDGVLYCHATPRDDEEILTRRSSDDRFADALAGVDARLVVAGHTHQQDDRRVGHVRWVNAGSVGLPYEGDAAARWAWIADGEPELRRTPYDAAAAGRKMLDAGWPDEQSVAAALIDPVAADFVTELFESRAAG